MRALGLTDGSAGMAAQVRALAEAMGMELEEKTITVNKAWHYLPNRAVDLGLGTIFPATQERFDTLPDIVISCGRKAALVAATLANRPTSSHTQFIHIQDPQMSPKHFNLVIAMEHDRLRGDNVLTVPYALHSITPAALAAAKEQWQGQFGYLRKPWNAILIGGSTRHYRFTQAALQKLIADVEQIDGALLITTSRRTGADHIRQLATRWRNNGRVYLYTGEGKNPYLGMLACADHIYVTNDSVNMMSEALAAGKPVSILALQGHVKTKPARFAKRLHDHTISPQEMMNNLVVSIRKMLA